MGLPGIVLSAFAFVAGAIMYWALTAQRRGDLWGRAQAGGTRNLNQALTES
jgi:hypothetical protein